VTGALSHSFTEAFLCQYGIPSAFPIQNSGYYIYKNFARFNPLA